VAAFYQAPVLAGLTAAGFSVQSAVLPPGETTKTLAQAERLYDAMLRADVDRGSIVVALGGGVVTDLAGFVAATYMRGIAWIALPTSLLGQVDASVGGKTAVDHPECKNLVGAFHAPAAVLADVRTLATLPDEELRTGLAEVVKHAVIRDAALMDLVESHTDALLMSDPVTLEEVVARNIRIKVDVVAADEREAGLRRILNYGHTVGHAIAIALLAAGRPTTHGRAVALGMVAEARLAARRGLLDPATVDRLGRLLARLGLPTTLADLPDADRLLDLLRHDKKAEGGRLRFVLPTAVGAVTEVDDVAPQEIRDALATLRV